MHELWLKDISHWRDERRIRIGYDGARYALPALEWTQSSFIQPQTMVHDRYLYDPAKNAYTVDRYVADLEKRYGGVDAVLIWPTYPNMGIDNRNQQDMIRSMPGGVAGVKQMVADFHRHHIRVLFPMMMWDPLRLSKGCRHHRTSPCVRAGKRAARRRAGLEPPDLGTIQLSVRAQSGPLQVARAAPHGQYLRPVESQ
jgi:hypothetical protein